MRQLLMGNEAMAWGAIKAGVNFVSGYPGTPSSEVLETVAKNNPGSIYVEWSVNEKAALEAAAGAAYAGARALVTMKQVGLNVASDPLMSLSYIGVQGGMVILSADDPGPISSQTEQDTRSFAKFAKLPVFDPTSPEEAFFMIGEAFAFSETIGRPVLFRPTTRVCHGSAPVELDVPTMEHQIQGFKKDSKWVIFPRLSYQNHLKIENDRPEIGKAFSSYPRNHLRGEGKRGIAFGGISYSYGREALGLLGAEDQAKTLKVATPFPFPEDLALDFLAGLEEVLVLEELDPVIEENLVYLAGKYHLPVRVWGKHSGHTPRAGELSVTIAKKAIAAFLSLPWEEEAAIELPSLPIRPPVLCAGCPHRGSFYAVKRAMKGKKAVFTGDIGCYTLGNAMPLDMVDTCLCMGAGITIAQGLHVMEPEKKHFAFIGDSTFFHTGLAGIINGVYNRHDFTAVILDNRTTAMTGHQPHPGMGRTMMGEETEKISIPALLEAAGVKYIKRVNPLHLKDSIKAVKEAAAHPGIAAVIFESSCIALFKTEEHCFVREEACTGCKKCIKELGCPALHMAGEKVEVDESLCNGCRLCAQICPAKAIEGGRADV